MILENYRDYDSSGGIRNFVKVRCEVCESIFIRQLRKLDKHTCSIQCSNVLRGKTIKTSCANCDKVIYKSKRDFEKAKTGLNFCDRKCKDSAQWKIESLKPIKSITGFHNYRERAFQHYGKICNLCSIDNPLVLEVHHKSKDRNDNSIENLQVLCANCHTLIHKQERQRNA